MTDPITIGPEGPSPELLQLGHSAEPEVSAELAQEVRRGLLGEAWCCMWQTPCRDYAAYDYMTFAYRCAVQPMATLADAAWLEVALKDFARRCGIHKRYEDSVRWFQLADLVWARARQREVDRLGRLLSPPEEAKWHVNSDA